MQQVLKRYLGSTLRIRHTCTCLAAWRMQNMQAGIEETCKNCFILWWGIVSRLWQQHHRALPAACNPRWARILMTGESSRDLYGTWVSPGGGIWCCPTELRSSLLLSSPAMNFYRFCCCNLHYYLPGRSRTTGFCCRLSLLFLLMERMGN